MYSSGAGIGLSSYLGVPLPNPISAPGFPQDWIQSIKDVAMDTLLMRLKEVSGNPQKYIVDINFGSFAVIDDQFKKYLTTGVIAPSSMLANNPPDQPGLSSLPYIPNESGMWHNPNVSPPDVTPPVIVDGQNLNQNSSSNANSSSSSSSNNSTNIVVNGSENPSQMTIEPWMIILGIVAVVALS